MSPLTAVENTPTHLGATAKPGQYLTLQLGPRVYGVAVRSVREINPMTDITPVPRTASFVAGVMNLRGKIIPVIDLRLKLGLPATETTRATCIVVVETAEDSQGNHMMGVIVDSVHSVIELSTNQIEPPPVLGETASLRFIVGMGKIESQVLILLDVTSTLSAEELQAAHGIAA
ncbi:MAG: chemotaxis protein CheW [Bdellovibrionales bacterium]|nr:chemotaxis protein CheW [Bdellovibrionales bacterium]